MRYSLKIEPRAPFDFDKSLRFLSGFPATKNEQVIAPNQLLKGFRIQRVTVLAELTAIGTVDQPCLSLNIHSETPLPEQLVTAVEQRVRFMLSLDEDLIAFYQLAAQDDAFQKQVMPALYGYRQVKFPSPFENACWSILAQRQPLAQSRCMKQALIDSYSQTIQHDNRVYEAFPDPDDFMPLDAQEISQCIGNARKGSYLESVIRAFVDQSDDFLRDAPYEEVKDWLLSIKGIGEWSTTFILLRGLGRMKQALIADPESTFNQSMIRAAKPVYGDISLEELRTIADCYNDWQGYWAHFLKAHTAM